MMDGSAEYVYVDRRNQLPNNSLCNVFIIVTAKRNMDWILSAFHLKAFSSHSYGIEQYVMRYLACDPMGLTLLRRGVLK